MSAISQSLTQVIYLASAPAEKTEASHPLQAFIDSLKKSQISIDDWEKPFKTLEFGSKKSALALCQLLYDVLIPAQQDEFVINLMEILTLTHSKHDIEFCQTMFARQKAYDARLQELAQKKADLINGAVKINKATVDRFKLAKKRVLKIDEVREQIPPALADIQKETKASIEEATTDLLEAGMKLMAIAERISAEETECDSILRNLA